jgi:AcrR family transcriptional regulator
MPRPKTLPDARILDIAHRLIHAEGPAALTFARLSNVCGLSGATLVQRFGNKDGLMRATLLHAWDKLDARTIRLAAKAPRSPAGAVALLVGLSRNFGGIEAYADGLLVLREDLRDPALRARGTAWHRQLSAMLEACFPQGPHQIGQLMAAQWQGLVLWWGFDPRGKLEVHVKTSLTRFVAALTAGNRTRD